jgi:hypothetical protein
LCLLESSDAPHRLPGNDADFMTDYGSTLQYSFVEGYVDPHGDDHQGASFETDVAASYSSGCFAGDSNLVVPQNGAYWTDHEAFQCLNPSQGSLPFLPLPETSVWVDFSASRQCKYIT